MIRDGVFNRACTTLVMSSACIVLSCFGCDEDRSLKPRAEGEGPVGGSEVIVEVDDMDVGETDLAHTPDEGADAASPIVVPPQRVTSVVVELTFDESVAGQPVTARCVARDALGMSVDLANWTRRITPQTGWVSGVESEQYIGQRAGVYAVRCIAGDLGLISEAVSWTVVPDTPIRTIAIADKSVIQAGSATSVSCQGRDAFDNLTEVDESVLTVDVMSDRLGVYEDSFTSTLAGEYLISCVLNALDAIPTRVTVTPSIPDRLGLSVTPERAVYAIGSIVTVRAEVLDEFDHILSGTPVILEAEPALNRFGDGRYQLNAEGVYEITGSVMADPDHADSEIQETLSLIVDSSGPQITCDTPLENSLITWRDEVELSGHVSDTLEVNSVMIDGVETPVDDEGIFSVMVTPKRGLNWHLVSATDRFGNANEIVCAYVTAESYVPDDTPIGDSIILLLEQPAVDDGAPAEPVGSLADLFRGVIESDGLIDEINQAATSQNPIVPDACVQDSFLGCILSVEGTLRDVQLLGSRPISLEVSDAYGGTLRFTLRLNNLRLNLNLRGRAVGIGYDTNGYIEASFISVGAHFGISAPSGIVDVSLAARSESVEIGALTSSFEGVSGAVIDFAFPLIEGSLRGTIQSSLSEFVFTTLDEVLSASLGALNLSVLGFDFDLEGLNGQPISVNLATSLSGMSVSAEGLKVGLSTLASGERVERTPVPGIPVLWGAGDERLGRGRGIVMNLQMSMINQILYALWRAGFFMISERAETTPSDEGGLNVELRLLAPPMLEWTQEGTMMRVHFGPAIATLDYPQLFPEPLSLRVVSTLTSNAGIDDLGGVTFGADGLNFEHLELELRDLPMSPEERAAVRDELGALIIALAEAGLGEALPSIPIPSFDVPPDLSATPNLQVGLRNPEVTLSPSSITLDGDFGQ